MVERIKDCFLLHTKNSSYIMEVLSSGHLAHLFYGEKIMLPVQLGEEEKLSMLDAIREKRAFVPGNSIAYSESEGSLCLEDRGLELSGFGKGDIREPFVELTFSEGGNTTDFLFEKAEIIQGKQDLKELPSAYGTEGVQTLIVTLKDACHDVKLELSYSVFEKCDAIVRSAKLINLSDKSVVVDRLMSGQLDLPQKTYHISTFHGAWAREMNRVENEVTAGNFVSATRAGVSSNEANPFVMLHEAATTEDAGMCIGVNLIYSGNHRESLSVGRTQSSRFLTGINPEGFAYHLNARESFQAPECVFVYSNKGFGGMSKHMHTFVRKHIVRGNWQWKERPILLNSWEAYYFDFNEAKLLKLAKAGKEAGIELFVLDDGWFGKRDNDACSLGDWTENKKKLPEGLAGLSEKINEMGMSFGIWVEPEMISEDSDCFRTHPDWAMRIPGQLHAKGRNQMLLDLANPQVQDYMIQAMSTVFSSGNISYVKWDMNRIVSDCYSPYLAKNHGEQINIQKETMYRYYLGLYRVLRKLTTAFPDILFEACASGGNRFDLGMLCYMPQIWASDNTDAICRKTIQEGYSYGYPMSAIGAHVSNCPNHQTLRVTPLETRFAVASFGVLGYECNFCELPKDEFEEIKEQILLYKKWRKTLQYGTFNRITAKNVTKWMTVGETKKQAFAMLLQVNVQPNNMNEIFLTKGLEEDKVYHFYNLQKKWNIKQFGDLVNTVSPIHVKKDSVIHNTLAKFVKMDGETEDYVATGAMLNHCGVRLHQAFAGVGYSDEVRLFQDYQSRIYLIEETEIEPKKELMG